MRPPLAEHLDLDAHPEGGWYRRTWTSPETIRTSDGRHRPSATIILYHLPAGDSSAWHRVTSDETWLAHRGVVELQLGGEGDAPEREASHRLGTDPTDGHEPQVLVPAGVWQRTLPADADVLVSCVVSPGFDFDDHELHAGP